MGRGRYRAHLDHRPNRVQKPAEPIMDVGIIAIMQDLGEDNDCVNVAPPAPARNAVIALT